jgi:hypothetical protein
MKTLTLAFLLTLLTSTALALEPYYPSPYAARSWFFSSPSKCWGGPTIGTCEYYGYGRNTGGYAIVTWDANGVPLSAVPCNLYAYEGEPVCPVAPK